MNGPRQAYIGSMGTKYILDGSFHELGTQSLTPMYSIAGYVMSLPEGSLNVMDAATSVHGP